MIHKELSDYIFAERSKGVTDEEIKKELLSKTWNESVVLEAMNDQDGDRGIFLTVWLSFMVIANTLLSLHYFFANSDISAAFPNEKPWVFYIYGLGGLLNAICAIFLFKRKKWAFQLIILTAIFAFFLNLIIGVKIAFALIGLFGPVLLGFIFSEKPNYLR